LTNGGGSGIRTRDTVSRIHTFQACAFNHSATPPRSAFALQMLVLTSRRCGYPRKARTIARRTARASRHRYKYRAIAFQDRVGSFANTPHPSQLYYLASQGPFFTVLLQDIQRDVAEDGEIVRAVSQSASVLIVVHDDIEPPMQPVFDAAMRAHNFVEALGPASTTGLAVVVWLAGSSRNRATS
jgi:hypothetical protein